MKLTRPKLQAWLDKMPPDELVNPASTCMCMLAQHLEASLPDVDHYVDADGKRHQLPGWAITFQEKAIAHCDTEKAGVITWATAARILRELPR